MMKNHAPSDLPPMESMIEKLYTDPKYKRSKRGPTLALRIELKKDTLVAYGLAGEAKAKALFDEAWVEASGITLAAVVEVFDQLVRG
jgi:hypothetical protein